MSDDAKKILLARRARFVATALAGLSIACGKEKAPQPCLDVPPPEDAAPAPSNTTPMPCLTVAPISPPPPRDAGKAGCKCDPNDPLCTCLP